MRIGIDISQLAYSGTGVANYLENLVAQMTEQDKANEYVLFYSSLRRKFVTENASLKQGIEAGRIVIKEFNFPPTLLELFWNKLHILPIESLIGPVDVFITSDWTEPPTRSAKKATILYDLIIYKYPEETHNQVEFNVKKLLLSPNIVASQKRRLKWVKKESDVVFCISEATKNDAKEILQLDDRKLHVLYPGLTL